MKPTDKMLAGAVTLPELLEEIVAQVGGPKQLAGIVATDLLEAAPGSANRVRLTTALMRLMLQTQEPGDYEGDLEALEDEEQELIAALGGAPTDE